MTVTEALGRLKKSEFRSSFHLKEKERNYVLEKGMDTVLKHAEDFVHLRLAPAHIPNDGRQTPMRGHPVFVAQHATACCCRGCFEKWYHVPSGRALTKEEEAGVLKLLKAWLVKEMANPEN